MDSIYPDRKPVLYGTGLTKTYRKKETTVRALSGIDIELYDGEILGVVGESGSGKSTLLKLIGKVETPDSGSLYHRGKDYTGASPKETGSFLQMIYQNAYNSFDPRMTMSESLKESRGYARDRVNDILRRVGLEEELLNRRPKALSGGQCQRMSVARALLADVHILLCDEITSALDVTTQAQVISLLCKLRESEGLSIIFVSHDIALVSNICDRVMVLKDGVCAKTGDVSRLEEYIGKYQGIVG